MFAEVIRSRLKQSAARTDGLAELINSCKSSLLVFLFFSNGLSELSFIDLDSVLQSRERSSSEKVAVLEKELLTLREDQHALLLRVAREPSGGNDPQATAAVNAELQRLKEKYYSLLDTKNESTERELALRMRLETVESNLKERTEQLQKVSAEAARLDAQNEQQRAECESKAIQYQTLADEHQMLQLEYANSEEKFAKKKEELDALLERWIKEKTAVADALNARNSAADNARQANISAELQAAAMSKDLGELAFDDNGACRAIVPSMMIQTVNAHDAEVICVTYNRQANQIATGSADKHIKLWDCGGNVLATLRGHTSAVSCFDFSPAGDFLVSGAANSDIHIFNLETFRSMHTMKNHSGKINALSYSSDASLVYSASQDHTVKSWDAKRGFFKASALVESTPTALCVYLSTSVLTAHQDKSLQCRDPRVDIKTVTSSCFSGHEAQITSVCM